MKSENDENTFDEIVEEFMQAQAAAYEAALSRTQDQARAAIQQEKTARQDRKLPELTEEEVTEITSRFQPLEEAPWPRERVEAHLAHLRPAAMPDMPVETPDLRQCAYRLGDRIWHVARACFVEDAGECRVIELQPPTAHNLKQTLMHYGLPVGAELYGADELAQLAIEDCDSQAAADIAAGFDYELDGVTYHFSLDLADQQNFSDYAQLCRDGELELAPWQAWRDDQPVALTIPAGPFLDLYKASVEFKQSVLQACRQAKATHYEG